MDPSDNQRAFSFIRVNHRPPKPRRTGVTEIRGPYYTPMGTRYLQDVLETIGTTCWYPPGVSWSTYFGRAQRP
jgi:phosphosulfolactate synthase (CoM biosynthesis protein A)